MMPVQVRLQVRLHVRENQLDSAMGQILLKLPHHPRGCIVHVRNRSGIHDQSAQGRWLWPGKEVSLVRKRSGICIEERRTKSIDDQSRLGYRSGSNGG